MSHFFNPKSFFTDFYPKPRLLFLLHFSLLPMRFYNLFDFLIRHSYMMSPISKTNFFQINFFSILLERSYHIFCWFLQNNKPYRFVYVLHSFIYSWCAINFQYNFVHFLSYMPPKEKYP